MSAKIRLVSSIENAPLIHKFSILFIVMSLVPFLVIVYLFWQFRSTGKITLDENTFFMLIVFLGPGALVGFFAMRKSIMKIQVLTQQATKSLVKDIPGLANPASIDENEITQLTRAFSEATKNLEGNITRLEASKRTMQYVLSKLAVGMTSLQTIDTFLELIVEITANALDARVGVLMLLDEEKQELYLKNISGIGRNVEDIRLKVGEEVPGWVAKHKKPLLVPALQKISNQSDDDIFSPPLLCSPMLYQDRVIGVLLVSGRITGGSFAEDELLIISNLASQTAIAVENDRLHLDAEKTYLETISALAMAVEARDHYSRGHSDRVSQYSVKIAEKLGLDADTIKNIKDAAELHDIGKIGITDDILRKSSSLSDEEMDMMRKHPVIGEGIVKPVRSLARLCSIIRGHHEWMDGSGYPDKLKDSQIPLEAKILAVTDSFDAMTTDRPYRKGFSADVAKEELRKYIGVRYDKRIVEIFSEIV
ncbi:MAG: HD domain-containing phosphohydrolase [Candidatus Omnitrophota bacterium]|jgi:HD-GYP domain-containing protein (c-di-GMP phosphodiesterase class II)